MNENLDLMKILDGCPKETEFYSTVYGEVTFVEIDSSFIRPIIVRDNFIGDLIHISNGGRAVCGCGECTLFPAKDQRDWSKFERFWNKPKFERFWNKPKVERFWNKPKVERFWNKPKVERFNPHTLQPFDKVLVKDDYGIWQVEFFSHICHREPEGLCQCSGNIYFFCIPYNEETMPLVGTKEDCPEYYKWWEE